MTPIAVRAIDFNVGKSRVAFYQRVLSQHQNPYESHLCIKSPEQHGALSRVDTEQWMTYDDFYCGKVYGMLWLNISISINPESMSPSIRMSD